MMCSTLFTYIVFFYNSTSTPDIYTLSLHDALPISAALSGLGRRPRPLHQPHPPTGPRGGPPAADSPRRDRKSTRLNSSHQIISYAVFCLKKKNNNNIHINIKLSISLQCTSHQHTSS